MRVRLFGMSAGQWMSYVLLLVVALILFQVFLMGLRKVGLGGVSNRLENLTGVG